MHYISFITSTLHILHGGCITRVSRIHCIYFIEHTWHIPTDVYTTHKSPYMWIHYICTMVYTKHMHHGGRVMHTWSCICRAILRSQLCTSIFYMRYPYSIFYMHVMSSSILSSEAWMNSQYSCTQHVILITCVSFIFFGCMLLESSNMSAGSRCAGAFSQQKSQFLRRHFDMRVLFMRSYTEVNPGNSRNWVKFGGTVQGNPGTIWGYPGTILGYPGTIWELFGATPELTGTVQGCHLALTLQMQISVFFFFCKIIHVYP